MSLATKLDKDERGKDVNQKLYRGMTGSLLYLTTSRPDIMLLFAYVLDFKHVLKNLIYLLLKGSLDIL